MSDEAVIRRVTRNFVPVALNLYTIRVEKSPAGDFFRAMQKQRPEQYQGIWIVSSEGKILSTQSKEPEKRETWAQALLSVIKDGLTAFGEVTPRNPEAIELLPDRGVGRREDGSIVLKVHTRLMLLGLDKRGLGEPTFDSVVLTATDLGKLEFPNLTAGSEFDVPLTVARKLHRVLSPSSDANTMPRADEVTEGKLSATVERVRGEIVYLNFKGKIAGIHTWEFDPHKGKKIPAEMTFTGVGTCEKKTGKLLSMTLIGDGRYRTFPPYEEVKKFGAVVEWRRKK